MRRAAALYLGYRARHEPLAACLPLLQHVGAWDGVQEVRTMKRCAKKQALMPASHASAPVIVYVLPDPCGDIA